MIKSTRRNLLQAVGASAGAAAVYRTMDAIGLFGPTAAYAATPVLPQGSGEGGRVVIFGAGLSGLTAAWELAQAGWQCVVLEATARAGGRNLTVRGGDRLAEEDERQEVGFDRQPHFYANLGPAHIPYHHRTVLGYCKQFGIPLEVFTNDNRAGLLYNQDRFGGTSVPTRKVLTDMRGYVAELLSKAVDRGALDAELTEDDRERVRAMLKAFGHLTEDGN